jgi:alpha-methylacyl-CoA racemase
VPRQQTDGAEQAAVIDEVRAIFATRTRDEWLAFFEHRDVCVTPVNAPAEALADPHVVARGTVGRGVGLSAIRAPFVNEGPALAPAPAVGAHTTEVLAGLGVQPASTC